MADRSHLVTSHWILVLQPGVFAQFLPTFLWLAAPTTSSPLLGRSTQPGWVAQHRSQRSHEGMAQHLNNCRAGFCFPLQGLMSPASLASVLTWLTRQKVLSGLGSAERGGRHLHWVTWHPFGRRDEGDSVQVCTSQQRSAKLGCNLHYSQIQALLRQVRKSHGKTSPYTVTDHYYASFALAVHSKMQGKKHAKNLTCQLHAKIS